MSGVLGVLTCEVYLTLSLPIVLETSLGLLVLTKA